MIKIIKREQDIDSLSTVLTQANNTIVALQVHLSNNHLEFSATPNYYLPLQHQENTVRNMSSSEIDNQALSVFRKRLEASKINQEIFEVVVDHVNTQDAEVSNWNSNSLYFAFSD